MKREAVAKLLKALGAKETFDAGEWVSASCPLAYWTHAKGRDSRPSFGVNVVSGMFNCHACRSGPVSGLVQEIQMHLESSPELEGRFNLKLAYEILAGLTSEVDPLPEFSEFPDAKDAFREWPQWYLDQFPSWKESDRAKWYLATGRVEINKSEPVDPTVADAFDLRYDATFDRLVAPYRTMAGKLAGARGRTIDPTSPHFPHYDYTWNKINNSHLVWFNEPVLEKAADARAPIVIVEGQFDCFNVARVYPYVMAGLSAKASAEKIQKLEASEGVITMLDNDAAGDQAHQRYKKLLGPVVKGRLTYPSHIKDPAKIPLELLKEILGEVS